MSEITCSYGCWMKLDLQNAEDKLLLLKDNWPSFFDIECIAVLSKDELKCSMCLLDVILEAATQKKHSLPKKELKSLISIRSFMSTIDQSSNTTDDNATDRI